MKKYFLFDLDGTITDTGEGIMKSAQYALTAFGFPQQTAAQKDFPATVREVVLSGALSRRGRRFFYSGEEKEMARRAMERLAISDLERRCFQCAVCTGR